MNKNLTEIICVIDRSGSMKSCSAEAQSGFNSFVEEQKKKEGQARLTLVEFDDQYEIVHNGIDIKEVPPYILQARGMTAYCDAIGKTINTVGERLNKTPENERPGLVIFVIISDGEENSSKEFNRAKIKEMIEHQENKYSWQFTFMGANIAALQEANQVAAFNSAVAQYANMSGAYAGLSMKCDRMRSASACGQRVDNAFSTAELQAMGAKSDIQ